MSEQQSASGDARPDDQATWGPVLFYVALVAVLVFFWWMVIYTHGVEGH